MKIDDFAHYKQQQKPISMITCYDYTFARLIENTTADCVLVGDSAAMTMHGYNSTVPATLDIMCMHTAAVAKGLTNKFLIGDLPFLSYQKSLSETMLAVQRLMQAGAHAVKLEGCDGLLDTIAHIVQAGVAVMGHIGLTPQSAHALGGYKVQGKDKAQADKLLRQAKQLQQAGCFSIVLECVPSKLADEITKQLTIPTIGIGAGPHTDGQVLVLQDLLGLNTDFKPRFVKQYMDGANLITQAINNYVTQTRAKTFPDIKEHCY